MDSDAVRHTRDCMQEAVHGTVFATCTSTARYSDYTAMRLLCIRVCTYVYACVFVVLSDVFKDTAV